MTAPGSTWDNVKIAWPVLASLAAGVAFLATAVLGAPTLVTLPLAVVMIGAPSIGTYLSLRKDEGRGRGAALAATAAGPARAAFLLGLALAVVLTVLIGIDGLRAENVLIGTVAWSVVLAAWFGERALRRVGGDA